MAGKKKSSSGMLLEIVAEQDIKMNTVSAIGSD